MMRTLTKVQLLLSFVITVCVLPFGICGYVVVFGGEYPLGGAIVGLLFGIIFAVVAAVACIAFLCKKNWRAVSLLTLALLAVDVAWIPAGFIRSLIGRPHNRQKLALDTIKPPLENVSGVWHGKWTDARKDFTEMITLNLSQSNGVITGTIMSEGGRKFDILDGVLSGHRINLYYNVAFPERPSPGDGGSLVGEVRHGNMQGTWYAHERPERGWSRDGPWEATYQGAIRHGTNTPNESSEVTARKFADPQG